MHKSFPLLLKILYNKKCLSALVALNLVKITLCITFVRETEIDPTNAKYNLNQSHLLSKVEIIFSIYCQKLKLIEM